jgi:hypothetical protein
MAKVVLDEKEVEKQRRLILQYLREYAKRKLKDAVVDKVIHKIAEKIAKKLGLEAALNFITGNLPGKKIADFAVLWFKWLLFEGFLVTYADTNPYDPLEEGQQDQYVEYLLYSWARTGKPSYRYFWDCY